MEMGSRSSVRWRLSSPAFVLLPPGQDWDALEERSFWPAVPPAVGKQQPSPHGWNPALHPRPPKIVLGQRHHRPLRAGCIRGGWKGSGVGEQHVSIGQLERRQMSL